MEAILSITCEDERVAGSLERTLSPDNRDFPKGQAFEVARKGRQLRFSVSSSTQGTHVLSTLESVLSDASLFQRIWEVGRASAPVAEGKD